MQRIPLAVRLVPAKDIERLPENEAAPFQCLGIGLPLVLVDPSSASAPARIRAALEQAQMLDPRRKKVA